LRSTRCYGYVLLFREDKVDFREGKWLFPIAVTPHNLEESIWLRIWSETAAKWHRPVGAREFRFAKAVLTTLAFAVTAPSAAGGRQS
jgi:hypothetical protein